jgi:WD40 repeat protein
MANVFISYSRKDRTFVSRLHEGFTKLNRDVWVDFEDIPFTADWWKEIQHGIEGADSFVFVISPESLSSPICMMEVSHAVQHHKRLVPLMLELTDQKAAFELLVQRELDDNTRAALNNRDLAEIARVNWQSLSRHNWLMFEDESQFEGNFRSLISAIDTDLDHARAHTRLLVRAREWESSSRNQSFLLRGDDLKAAESWLQQGAAKSPSPTPLHTDYIVSSRQRAIQAQRNVMVRVAVGGVISLIFAIMAGVGAIDAYQQRGRAENNAQTATNAQGKAEALAATSDAALFEVSNSQSLLLAALAKQQLQAGAAQDALLLAQEGLKDYPRIYHVENLEAVIEALSAPVREAAYMTFANDVLDSQWNTAGTQVVIWSVDGRARVWSAETGQTFTLLHNDRVNGAGWSPDETKLVTWSEDGTVRTWDSVSGNPLLTMQNGDRVFSALWVGDYIAAFAYDNAVRIWNPSDGTMVGLLRHEGEIMGVTADKAHIFTWAADGVVRKWDAATLETLQILRHPEAVLNTVLNSEETLLTTATNHEVRVWDIATGTERYLRNYRNGIRAVAWNPQETVLMTAGLDGIIQFWNAVDGTRRTVRHGAGDLVLQSVAWDAAGELVLSVSNNSIIRIWEASTGKLLRQIYLPEIPKRVEWSPDGRMIAVMGLRTAWLYDAEFGQQRHEFKHDDNLRGLMWNSDGFILITWSWDKTIRFWDTITGIQSMLLRNDGVASLHWNGDETRFVSMSDDDTVRVWSRVDQNLLPAFSYQGAAFNPAKPQIAFWSNGDSVVVIVDPETLTETGRLAHDSEIRGASYNPGVSWSPDGKQIITWSGGGVTVWDAETYAVSREIRPEGSLRGALWNPDQTRLLTWTRQNQLQSWDLASGEIIATTAFGQAVPFAEWSQRGTHSLLYPVVDELDQIWIWDTADDAPPVQLDVDTSDEWGSWLSPDGSKVFTWDRVNGIRIWDTAAAAFTHTLTPEGRFSSFLWGSRATGVAWGGGALYILQTGTWQILHEMFHTDEITGATWSDDESEILSWSRDRTVRVWNAATGQERLRLIHDDWVAGAAWNTDETLILSWSYDRTVRIWDAQTGKELLRIPHDDVVLNGMWGTDESVILARANSYRLWYTDVQRYLVIAQAAAVRSLSNTERGNFFLPTLEPTATVAAPTALPTLTASPMMPSVTPMPSLTPSLIPTIPPTRTPGAVR